MKNQPTIKIDLQDDKKQNIPLMDSLILNNNNEYNQLPTGLEIIVSETIIDEAWKSQMPKKFLIEFFYKYLRQKAIIDQFEDIEITVISEFILYNLIFIKEELNLNSFKTTILMNIFLQLIIKNNLKFQQEGEKNKNSDFQNFKQILLDHSIENPPKQIYIFDQKQITIIMDYAIDSYFDVYKLYEQINKSQKKEQFSLQICVDQPQYIPPLKEALYKGNPAIHLYQPSDDEIEDNNQKKNSTNLVHNEKVEISPEIINFINQNFDKFNDEIKAEIQKENQKAFAHAQIS